MTTIKDIAKHLSLSPSTVSRALRSRPEISVETIKRVTEAAEELNYTPNRFAQQLVGHKIPTIGFTIPDINDSFFSKTAHGAEEMAHNNGYEIAYMSLERNEKKLCEFIVKASEYRYDGVIITPERWNDELVALIRKVGIPVVGLRRKSPKDAPDIPYADSNHLGGSSDLVEYLLGLGHRKIAMIGFDSIVFNERRMGYESTMMLHGLSPVYYGSQVALDPEERIKTGCESARTLLTMHPDTTAIIGTDDLLAIGAMQHLYEAGISVPSQMSVAGFDDREITRLFNIQLTTVHPNMNELGRHCIDMLLQMINSPGMHPTSIMLQTQLIVRKTTAPPRV